MNKKISFISLGLSCMMMLSMLGACKRSTEEIKKDPPKKTEYQIDTLHVYDVKDSTYDLIEDRKSEYTIVYPHLCGGELTDAVVELQNLIAESTGIRLPAIADNAYSGKGKILSVGATIFAKAEESVSSLMASYTLTSQGYIIKTVGDSVYMLGETELASLYASYEFLKWQFGIEFYSATVYSIDKNVVNRKLKDFNVVDVPDFENRSTCNLESINARLRCTHYSSKFNEADGNSFAHNYFNLVNPSIYNDANKPEFYHPEWFAGTQLCLTAGGNEESKNELVNVVAESMIDRLEAQPDRDWISFSCNDGGEWCRCAACTRDNNLYDQKLSVNAFAVQTRFINLVADKVKVWNQAECPERDITIFVYAYGGPRVAPVKMDENKVPIKDENGNYIPYSDDLILRDNVGVVWCGLGEGMVNIDDSHYDKDKEDIKRLKACMANPKIYFWTYSAFFQDYFLPNNTTITRQELYQFLKSYDGVAIFDMAQYNNGSTTDFGALKAYISAKLAWNCQLDVPTLVRNFFTYYYGEASKVMYEYYEDYQIYMSYLLGAKGYTGSANSAAIFRSSEYFPYEVICSFITKIDSAYKEIDDLKVGNPARYEELYKRILKESLSWRYLEMVLYPDCFTLSKLIEMQEQFRQDAYTCGISENREYGSVDTMFAS